MITSSWHAAQADLGWCLYHRTLPLAQCSKTSLTAQQVRVKHQPGCQADWPGVESPLKSCFGQKAYTAGLIFLRVKMSYCMTRTTSKVGAEKSCSCRRYNSCCAWESFLCLARSAKEPSLMLACSQVRSQGASKKLPSSVDAAKWLADLQGRGLIKAVGLTNFDVPHLLKVKTQGDRGEPSPECEPAQCMRCFSRACLHRCFCPAAHV